MIYQKPINWL